MTGCTHHRLNSRYPSYLAITETEVTEGSHPCDDSVLPHLNNLKSIYEDSKMSLKINFPGVHVLVNLVKQRACSLNSKENIAQLVEIVNGMVQLASHSCVRLSKWQKVYVSKRS